MAGGEGVVMLLLLKNHTYISELDFKFSQDEIEILNIDKLNHISGGRTISKASVTIYEEETYLVINFLERTPMEKICGSYEVFDVERVIIG